MLNFNLLGFLASVAGTAWSVSNTQYQNLIPLVPVLLATLHHLLPNLNGQAFSIDGALKALADWLAGFISKKENLQPTDADALDKVLELLAAKLATKLTTPPVTPPVPPAA